MDGWNKANPGPPALGRTQTMGVGGRGRVEKMKKRVEENIEEGGDFSLSPLNTKTTFKVEHPDTLTCPNLLILTPCFPFVTCSLE